MGTRRVTLAEWAAKIGRSEESVRNHWRPLAGFPAPAGRRPRPGPGPGPEEYEEADLDKFRANLESTRQRPAPQPYPCPGDPDEELTLGAIARRLGVDGKTITQYRPIIDEHVAARQQGSRRYYRLGAVIGLLNEMRRGVGVAHKPNDDLRRRPNRRASNR